MPVNIWDYERSPCIGCVLEDKDKRGDGCMACEKRQAYVELSDPQPEPVKRKPGKKKVSRPKDRGPGRPKKAKVRGRPKLNGPPSRQIHSLIPKALYAKMKKRCTKKKMTARDFIEQAIREKIER